MAGAEPSPLSGTVVYTARLGLPALPFGDVGGANPVALLGGSSTMRVWSDGGERSRVALLGATSEYSVVQDGAGGVDVLQHRRRRRALQPRAPPTPPGTTT